ncbi:GNAT family N-acetyltransferase [Algibacter amylolyticus]|uniref:GNAT family N-acetyltransferase n=1 Tax=Algibacter amylolyticus TaxID=1608400 RepID=A0A5M7B379_9FLAO|nr:GNAT family N-acetyltransferase [Algibacter amylolyticus]KAA5824053.1 GNAT family N-acetyltransferase [Algibacter amylolyticus]MBB5269606.1 hypothetical protein [Algibacter amylolyticus]TSJ74530.1 GNAT family N-acetyltransferase [Algibacter amylolyticus]
MKTYRIEKYKKEFYEEWNNFLMLSKNSTFLFHRDYMEYHSDRFEDYSLLIYKDNKLIALLPANIKNNVLTSHEGLSYGGLLLPDKIPFSLVLEALETVLEYLSIKKIEKLIIKQVPKIYHQKLANELEYLLFILEAKLFRRDLSMTIKLDEVKAYSKLRNREIKKAIKHGLVFKETTNFKEFWTKILVPNLKTTFGVLPVHNLTEISSLNKSFPDNIRQFNVFDKGELLAGCTIFETGKVAHLQYIATNKLIKKGALDFLIDRLITDVYKEKLYFDFGISNENQGKNINLGLLNWKQSFGASGIVHDFYEIQVKNHPSLKNVML